MKKLYIKVIIALLVFTSFTSKSVDIKLISEHKYSTYRQSAWGFNIRYDLGLISMNHSYIGAYLFDTSFNVVKHYETKNGAMGGGNGQLSPDGKLYAGFEKREMDTEIDTLSIYNIETKDEKYLTFPMHSNYKWFNDSKRILIYKYGKFDIYDIDKGLLQESVINLNDNKTPLLSCDYILLDNDNYLITSNRKGNLLVYNTSDWSVNRVIDNHGDAELKVSDDGKLLLVESSNTVYAYSINDYEKLWEVTLESEQSICEFSLSHNSVFLIAVDCGGNVSYIDVKTNKTTSLLKNDGNSRYSAVHILKGDKEFYLDRNGNTILHYKIIN